MIKSKLLNQSEKIIIAIDGTSGAGKGTLAKLIAEKFCLVHCQTSLFYRGLAYEVLKSSMDSKDAIINLSEVYQTIPTAVSELYSPQVTKMASIISAIPEVRANLIKPQQNFLLHNKRVVMEGRDIGTVIAPNADLKLFITADLDVRAYRRYNQIRGSVSLEQIKEDLNARDLRDTTRSVAPLTKANDAIDIDTSKLTPEEILQLILEK